jgi:hypothetical protein
MSEKMEYELVVGRVFEVKEVLAAWLPAGWRPSDKAPPVVASSDRVSLVCFWLERPVPAPGGTHINDGVRWEIRSRHSELIELQTVEDSLSITVGDGESQRRIAFLSRHQAKELVEAIARWVRTCSLDWRDGTPKEEEYS